MLTIGSYFSIIDSTNDAIIKMADLSETIDKLLLAELFQIDPLMKSHFFHPVGCYFPNTKKFLYRKTFHEFFDLVWSNERESIRFFHVGCDFGDEFAG